MAKIAMSSSISNGFDLYQQICKKLNVFQPEWSILVDIKIQLLTLFKDQKIVASYPVSTGKNGIGQEEGSGKTPLGLHMIQEKIGDGAHPYAIFKSRLNTGEVAAPNGEGFITTRILRLSGLEESFNKGKNTEGHLVDTLARYVYIHGTNEIEHIGQPRGAGCVRLKPEDMIELFNHVPEKTLVYIYV